MTVWEDERVCGGDVCGQECGFLPAEKVDVVSFVELFCLVFNSLNWPDEDEVPVRQAVCGLVEQFEIDAFAANTGEYGARRGDGFVFVWVG